MTEIPAVPRPRLPADASARLPGPEAEMDPEELEQLRLAFLTSMFPAWEITRTPDAGEGWSWSAVRRRPLTPLQEARGLLPRLDAGSATDLAGQLARQDLRARTQPP